MRAPGHYEDGFSLVEVLVGIAIFAALAGSLVFAGAAYGRSLRQSAAVEAATTSASTIVDSLERDGRSSIAIFTPTNDVANRSNSDGHEVDFYTRDASGAGSFAAYCFKSGASACAASQSTSSLALYRYAWSALPQNGGSGGTLVGSVADNLVGFSAKTIAASALLDATQNPTTAAYFARIGVTTAQDVARQTGFPGVLAGNRVTIINLSTSVGSRSVHLLAGSRPTRRQVVIATYTPPPNAMTVNGGSGATLSFPNPLAAAQSVTFAETNYGTRSTSPAQVYNVIGTTCSGNASYSPSSITPTNDGTGRGSMSVQPVVKVQPSGASCTITVADNSGQTQTVTVQIGQTYTPSASAPATGRPGQNGVFTISEQNYPTAPFSISLGGVCNNATVVSSTQSGGYYVEQVQVTYTAAGVCSISATDGYGQTATNSVSIYNNPVYTLSLAGGPSPSTITPGQTSTFTASATETQSSVPPGTPGSVPVSIIGNSGPCSVAQPNGTTFTFTASGSGSCSMTIDANASGVTGATTQNSPLSVMVSAANPSLNAGAASVTAASQTTLTLDSTAPSGGSGIGYAVQYYFQGGALVCNWVGYSCTVSGLSPNTRYNFTPLYGDSAGNRVWGTSFSGATQAAPLPTPTPTPPQGANCSDLLQFMQANSTNGYYSGGTGTFSFSSGTDTVTSFQNSQAPLPPPYAGFYQYKATVNWASGHVTTDKYDDIVANDQFQCT